MAAILVVDDRPINREFLATLLGYVGHRVLEAGDGAEALALVRRHRPDLVITDVLMPTMNGIEFANQLHADPAIAAIPVIFYTATYRLSEAHVMAESCGVSRVLAKPSEPQAILDAISAALGVPAPLAAPLPEAGGLQPALLGGKLNAYLGGLAELQGHLRQILDQGGSLVGADGELRRVSDRLACSLDSAHGLSLRLAAVVELGLEMGAERNPGQLVELTCRAAQDIMNARFAAIGIVDGDGTLRHLATRGLDEEAVAALRNHRPAPGILADLLVLAKVRRIEDTDCEPAQLGLPAALPPMRSLLATPLRTADRCHGWLLLGDKLGAGAFGDQDEQLAATLAAQLAPAYENLILYEQSRRYARDLELEVAERKLQQDKVARLSRVYAVLSGINSAIVRFHDRQMLFDEACRIAVEVGHFGIAWVGLVTPGSLAIDPVASRGGALLGRLHAAIRAEIRPGVGTVGEALKSGQPAFCNDLRGAPRLGLLRDEALAQGLLSAIALPLLQDQKVVGILALHAREADFFNAEELKLLSELAGDISFALQYIEREERLNYLAYYDPLTGLPNATLFRDRLNQQVRAAIPEQRGMATILIDLERFKHVNDTLGRHVGDQLLQAVAGRLREALHEPYSLARVGADTFALCIADLPPGADATTILRDRIFAPLALPFAFDGQEIRLAVQAGVALYPADGADAETLFRNAEAALKEAKAAAERYCYYAPAINCRVAERLALENELRAAVDMKQFVLHYQPRIDLVSGHIVAAEALIRWQHPRRGLVSPLDFIPLAEETGLIVPIGEWVIEAVCAQQVAWLASRVEVVPVAVNLSAVQIWKGNVTQFLDQALLAASLDPRYLELELTETVVMQDPEGAVRVLRALRQRGFKLALDDFGTGYSSLAYLKRFPFNLVKIDRAFITGITHNPEDAAIANAVIAIARRMNLKVLAEGVETEGQLAYLRSQNCDEMQGYYFSPPVAATEFQALLREGRRLPPAAEPSEERTLLLVDDERGVLAALRRVLRHDGYRILAAGSGREALELLATHPVQVIISDQRMPAMSGTEFLSVVKELYPDTIRIILSGYTDLDVVTDAVNRGAVYKFLTKPWDDALLREHIRDAFRRHRPTPPLDAGAAATPAA